LGYGPKQHVHVPYRSSSLTRVLMECFVKVRHEQLALGGALSESMRTNISLALSTNQIPETGSCRTG